MIDKFYLAIAIIGPFTRHNLSPARVVTELSGEELMGRSKFRRELIKAELDYRKVPFAIVRPKITMTEFKIPLAPEDLKKHPSDFPLSLSPDCDIRFSYDLAERRSASRLPCNQYLLQASSTTWDSTSHSAFCNRVNSTKPI